VPLTRFFFTLRACESPTHSPDSSLHQHRAGRPSRRSIKLAPTPMPRYCYYLANKDWAMQKKHDKPETALSRVTPLSALPLWQCLSTPPPSWLFGGFFALASYPNKNHFHPRSGELTLNDRVFQLRRRSSNGIDAVIAPSSSGSMVYFADVTFSP